MNKKKDIYCEMKFWDRFSQSIPSSPFSPGSETWGSAYKFIESSNIHIDISYSEIRNKALTDKAMLRLWKKNANGECDIIPEKNFPNIDSISKDEVERMHNAVFLTAKGDQICESASNRYGLIVLNVPKLLKSDYLFKESGRDIEKNSSTIRTWRVFKKDFFHPCNSLLIIDNYLVQTDSIIDTDLRDLLDSILPNHLDIPFDLAIFCKEIEYGQITAKYQKIWELLKGDSGIRKQLDIRLSLYKTNEFHDRAASSNHLYVESGAGFDRCGKSATTVKIVYPLVQNFSSVYNDAYNRILRTAYQVREKSNRGWNFEGDENNRLIDFGCDHIDSE